MKKILVGIGYGGFAPSYFGYALQLAHYFDASITLVHVYSNPTLNSEYLDTIDDPIYASQSKLEETSYHNSEVDRLKKFSLEYGLIEFEHVPVDTIVIDGDMTVDLTQLIDDGDYDLLIMGMRKHRLKDHLLGNVVQKVMDRIDIPMLLIPPLANIRLVKEIVYATAFDVGTHRTVEYILDWCLAFNAKVTLVHVTALHNKDKAKQKLHDLSEHYHVEKKAGVLSTKLLYGNVQKELDDYVERSESDMLVIHKRKQGFWKTISSDNLSLEMTESLNIPLLVLSNSTNWESPRLS